MIRVAIYRNQQLMRGGSELLQSVGDDAFIWIDIGDSDTATEESIFEQFGCHPLAVQDAQRVRHPPKCEVFPEQVFVLLRGLKSFANGLEFEPIQLAYFIGKQFLITRHKDPAISIERWWNSDELEEALSGGPMLLFSRLSNTLGKLYLELLLDFEPDLSSAEDRLLSNPDDSLLRELIASRTQLRKLHRIHSYHDRTFQRLYRDLADANRIDEHTKHALQDSFEKYDRLNSLTGLYYDLAGDLIDGHISLTSHKLNDTMRVLTVLTAIFVPLGFLAGIYGMNFERMPELHHPDGYFILLGFMATIAISLIALFKWKKWL